MRFLKKYKAMPVQLKASLWYTICNFFQKGISFVVVPIYIRLLTTAEYGEWSVFQSWRDILLIFASLNLYAGVYTKAMVDNKNDRDRYTSSMQGLGTLITIVLFIIYCLGHSWCNRLIGLNTPYMLLLFFYFVVYPGFAFWTTRQRVEYKYKSMVIVTIIISIFTPLMSLLLLYYTNLRANALVLGYLMVQCVIGGCFYIYQFIKGRVFYNKDYWKYALNFNIPLIPHYLSLIILNQSDRIMIKHFCSESDAGIYSFAYQIASAINVLISAINGSRVPWTYENLKVKVYDRIKKIINVLVLVMATIVCLICLMSPEVIAILGTSNYQIAIYVIPVVTLGVFYTFVYDLYASVEFYYGATHYVMYASVTGAILNIVLNAIFIPIYGFIAAAYTTLLCYIVFMLMHFFFSKKVLRDRKIDNTIYDNKTVFLISFIATCVTLVCMITFKFLVIRIVVISLILVVAILKRDVIIDMIKEIKK